MLLALFYEIYNIYQGHAVQERIPKSRKEDLFERFIRAVSESIDRKSTRLNSSHITISYAVFF